MNRQEILNMVAGKELNQLIASEIFNYELDESGTRFKINYKKSSWYNLVLSYSEDMDNAMLVVELLRKNGIYLTINISNENYSVSAYYECDIEVLYGKSLPLLICKIALLCNTYDFIKLEV